MRARQRYQINLTRALRKQVGEQIRSGKSTFILRRSNARSVHEVVIDGKAMRVVWDKSRGEIVTVLTPRETKAPVAEAGAE